jgi:hypothetical protein
MLFYILKSNALQKLHMFSKIYFLRALQNSYSVASTSQVRAPAMVLLLTVGN